MSQINRSVTVGDCPKCGLRCLAIINDVDQIIFYCGNCDYRKDIKLHREIQ